MERIKRIRWLLIEDDAYGESFARSINESDNELEHVFPVAADVESALRRLEQEPIAVVLLDLGLPPNASAGRRQVSREHGWKCAAEISVRFPEVKILIISTNDPDPNHAVDQKGLFDLGGMAYLSGYLDKSTKPLVIAKAIRQVIDQGTPYFSPDIYKLLIQTHDNGKISAEKWVEGFLFGDPCARHLTFQQHRVMLSVARGLTNREIAKELSLVEKTIDAYVTRCCARLNLDPPTKLMLTKWAAQNCLELKQSEGKR